MSLADTGVNMGNILVKSAVVDVGIQWALFAVAAALKTEKFYDLAGSGTFLFLAIQSLRWGNRFFLRQRIQTGMVVAWATRLGGFLFIRILEEGTDERFDAMRDNPSYFFIAWTIQAVWVFVTLLPTLILNSKKSDQDLTTRDYAGWTMWVIGFIFEALADHQKSVFRTNPENAGQFISSGLWSTSRHPNYFGEILMWLGMYLSASTTFRGWEHVGVISPLFVTYLLTRVSGIPLLERMALQRWGNDSLFQAYTRNTAVLVPFIY